jgi:8-oxo-dGTP pyrophosphatase MutT (NUDIX family)
MTDEHATGAKAGPVISGSMPGSEAAPAGGHRPQSGSPGQAGQGASEAPGGVSTPWAAVVTAAVWLHRRGDQVLGVRPHGSDAYFLPGGMPEPGESYAQATAREVREETGMTVDAASLRETARIEDDAYGRPGVRVLLVCFEGPGSGTPVAGDDEIAEVAWLPPSRWHQFAPAVRKALATRPPAPEQNQETGTIS